MSLGNELHDAVSSVNELSAASMGDSASPVGAIVRILNNQLQVSALRARRCGVSARVRRRAGACVCGRMGNVAERGWCAHVWVTALALSTLSCTSKEACCGGKLVSRSVQAGVLVYMNVHRDECTWRAARLDATVIHWKSNTHKINH